MIVKCRLRIWVVEIGSGYSGIDFMTEQREKELVKCVRNQNQEHVEIGSLVYDLIPMFEK